MQMIKLCATRDGSQMWDTVYAVDTDNTVPGRGIVGLFVTITDNLDNSGLAPSQQRPLLPRVSLVENTVSSTCF